MEQLQLGAMQLLLAPLTLGDFLLQSRVGCRQLGGALLDTFFQLIVCPFQGLVGLFEFGNVKADSLDADRLAILVAYHLDFTTNPYHVTVTGKEPIYGSKRLVLDQEARKFHIPTRLI